MATEAWEGPKFNNAVSRAMEMVNSERARVDGQLMEDFASVLRGNCFYFKEFVCRKGDTKPFEALKEELASAFINQKVEKGGGGKRSGAHQRSAQKASQSVDSIGDNEDSGPGPMGRPTMSTETEDSVAFSETSFDADAVKIISWSKHQLIENPTTSKTFNDIIAKAAAYFDLDVYQTRLNYYADASSWKPFHHDSHAYGGRALREDFTLGISLGSARDLAFLHVASERQFSFPQENGDVFAFTNEVNTKFMHGVPKVTCGAGKVGPRFSLIAWGRRRSLNERNGGQTAVPRQLKGLSNDTTVFLGGDRVKDAVVAAAHDLVSHPAGGGSAHGTLLGESAKPNDGDAAPVKKKEKKRRLQ